MKEKNKGTYLKQIAVYHTRKEKQVSFASNDRIYSFLMPQWYFHSDMLYISHSTKHLLRTHHKIDSFQGFLFRISERIYYRIFKDFIAVWIFWNVISMAKVLSYAVCEKKGGFGYQAKTKILIKSLYWQTSILSFPCY